MRTARRLTAAVASILATSALLSPSAAASPASPVPTPSEAATTQERDPLTPEQVKEQVAQAQALQAQLEQDDAALAAASTELARLSAQSNTLMDAVVAARAAEVAATRVEAAEQARLKELTAQVAQARDDLTNMAYDAYVNGPGSLRDVAAFLDLVTAGGKDADAAKTAEYLSAARSADEKKYEALARAQQQSAQKAVEARRAREAATAAAEAAQQEAASALAAQQGAVIALQKDIEARRAELAGLGVDAAGSLRGVDLATLGALTTTPLCTEENADYPNGRWPGSALCPVEGSPGHMMQPAAARALGALKGAYRKAHGVELCITDTYRNYAAQVDVRHRKPTLAAVPGTSNHGLGLATDLCGGIESFGTPQHRWMQQYAPLFGFYHPAWAQASGSKPEPWHWEYAG